VIFFEELFDEQPCLLKSKNVMTAKLLSRVAAIYLVAIHRNLVGGLQVGCFV
jgi:hypothetical protein